MTRDELPSVVSVALGKLGGSAPLVEIAKFIWSHHERELRSSGDLFFTWQYDMRWAAQRLRDEGKLRYSRRDGRAVWQLT